MHTPNSVPVVHPLSSPPVTVACRAYSRSVAPHSSRNCELHTVNPSSDRRNLCTDIYCIVLSPSTCPYVTSVGGTTGISPEVAANFSGGGFSNYFAAPDYQASAISTWKTNYGSTTNAGLYNTTGRGYVLLPLPKSSN